MVGNHSRQFDLICSAETKPDSIELVDGFWPVLLEKARQRPVRKQPSFSLTSRAIVRFVACVADSLHWCPAHRTWFSKPSVYGHLFAERGNIPGKILSRFLAKFPNPIEQGFPCS